MSKLPRSILLVSLSSLGAGMLLGAVSTGIAATVLGSDIFNDVARGSFYDQAVGQMYNAGIIRGYDARHFGPNDYVTRGQVAVMMQRLRDELLGKTVPSSSSSSRSSTASATSTSSSSSVATSENGAFRFTASAFTIPETVQSFTVSVVRSGGTEGDVTVTYTAKNGTATAGNDFTENTGTLTFKDGDTSKNFTISLKDDDSGEGNETVLLELKNPTGGAVLGAPSTGTLTILDNENPTPIGGSSSSTTSTTSGTTNLVGFTALAYEVSESSGTATITVERKNPSGTVDVNYATSDKTATTGNEYDAASGKLTFASGETTKTFTVTVKDDDSLDGKKALNLTLSQPTNGASLGTATALLSIADDEIGTFGSGSFIFSRSEFPAGEGETVTIIVNRVGGTKGTASVSYTTTNASAVTSDYKPTSGTLTFLSGESSKSFTVEVLNDSYDDPNEEFRVALSNPTGGAVLGSPNGADVTIP